MNWRLMTILVKKILGTPFKPAKRGASGELVFKKPVLWIVLVIGGCLAGWLALVMSLMTESSPDEEQLVYLLAVIAVGFTLFLPGVLSFKAEAGESSIKVRRWNGRRMLKYEEITSVEHTRFFGGQFILKSPRGTIRLSEHMTGIAELISLLSARIGDQSCTQANVALAKRKADFESY
ncbi:hypothetical protein RJP21_23730 [Paenibacillus sp. VCA1]|uniref:hypothetical protein n=1 Tax=Paenibacillus sp. VCA1 TaxID=3039148 RepID=UPI002870D2FC|nr:hypothetical protein [Paenibacillus sp. VCA1]MDR9856618.1 hypothetical protein [Paenibacillus sp. VCA1]